MKKILLFTTCLMACMGLWAQEANVTKLTIANATASSSQSGEGAEYAIDGDPGTLWHSPHGNGTKFPVEFVIKFAEPTHVDFVRYTPRPYDGWGNGNWKEVGVAYRALPDGEYNSVGAFDLKGSDSSYDFELGGVTCKEVRFTIKSGKNEYASAAEIEAFVYNGEKRAVFAQYFTDDLFTELNVTSSEDIEDAEAKALVKNMLDGADAYKKFRVGEYSAYETVATLQSRLKTNHQYSKYENPTGIYLKQGEACWVAVSGISAQYPVKLKIKNWLVNENSSSYALHNGLNYITATTEGNVFVDYYTDDFAVAPKVKMHFINAPVRGYWHEGMTNEEWQALLNGIEPADDNSIMIAQSERAQLAYPVSAWKQYCPTNVATLMAHYEHVQTALRYMMGFDKDECVVNNRQLFYAVSSGLMAANNEGSVCNVNSLSKIMTTDINQFDFWGVGHEWGHNNQIKGFHWSGCGETTNNIYASWAQINATPNKLRLEDEVSGIDEYSGMRGGRMQTYFEEGLRKGVQWQLQDGPDYHGQNPFEVVEYDVYGNETGEKVLARNYDHFVKLAPFWQLNLWGTKAEKCLDIIPMVIESIRNTENYTTTYNTNGKQQINWMKLACDKSGLNLLPFFEKAGMLKPINAYIEDYGKGWNIITKEMIDELKAYVAGKEYATPTEEINYINGHNYHIYQENLKLEVPATMNEGCSAFGNKVKVQHDVVKNAVAFETYNANDELIRITMYGLGSDDNHSFTQVLFPTDAAYIKAVGYDGARTKIYEYRGLSGVELTTDANQPKLYIIKTKRDREPVLQYDAKSGMFSVTAKVENSPAQAFYFMRGDNDRQVYVYPYLAEGKVLAADDVTDGHSKAKAMAKRTALYEQWSILPYANGYYNLQPVGTSTYLSHYGGGANLMGFYSLSPSDDQGSLFTFEQTSVEGSYAYQLLKNYYNNQVKVASSTIVGSDAPGYYPKSLAEAYNKAYSAAAEALKSMTNSDEVYQTVYAALVAANEALVMNMPKADEFYVMRSVTKNALVYANPTDNKLYWSTDKTMTDATAIWTILPSEVGGMYHISNLHTGTNFNGFIDYNPSPLSETAGNVNIVSLSADGQVGFKCNGTMMHTQGGGAVVHWETGANDGSAWRIEKVSAEQMASVKHDVTVGTYQYTSLYLNYPTTIPQGVEAYIAVEPSAETIKLVKLEGGVLPAETGVILYSATATKDVPATYNFLYTTKEFTDVVSGNRLKGSAYVQYIGDETRAKKYYIFGVKGGEVGLYWANMDYDADGNEVDVKDQGTHFEASANKVYLELDANGASLASGIRFIKETTGIDLVESAETDEPEIYTLYGQRISKVATSGIYIINGEKRYINVK